MPQNDPLREIWYWGKLLFWDMPGYVYSFFRILLVDWRTLEVHRTGDPSTLKGEQKELATLYARLLQYEGRGVQIRRELPQKVVSRVFTLSPDKPPPPLFNASLRLVSGLVASEGLYTIPKIDLNRKLSTVEIWDLTSTVNRHLIPFESSDVASRIEQTLETLLRNFLPEQQLELPYDEGETPLFVPFYDMLSQPAQKVEMALAVILREPPSDSLFPHLWRQLNRNTLIFSGLDPDDEGDRQKKPVLPTEVRNQEAAGIIQDYLTGTPLVDFLQTSLPFSIPFETRFSHTHVLGGTGHGKTQLLQHLILDDLKKLTEGKGSIVVIDSQGDLIRTITHLAEFSPSHPYSLADRLVLIDPNDTRNPPCLNLFDFGLDRLNTHDPVEQEKLKNGAIALYGYLFGALLRSEMTSRQDLVFTFLAKLLMTIPGATIRTLMELIKQPELTRQHFSKLDPVSKLFFEEEFFSKSLDPTRQQILARLWGVMAKSDLERMFGNKRNKLDLYEAMNRGSIILINTAKDLLKQDGCEIFGRFFIALIAQATQERAAIPENKRKSTFVYIDEAQDYFDEGGGLELLFSQARKYRVGLVISHQNLGQFERRLGKTVMANTAIKIVGGVSGDDAKDLAKDMRCNSDYLLSMRRGNNYSQFACYVKNYTERPIPLTFQFGEMERRPQITEADYTLLLERNRRRYCATDDEVQITVDENSSKEKNIIDNPDDDTDLL